MPTLPPAGRPLAPDPDPDLAADLAAEAAVDRSPPARLGPAGREQALRAVPDWQYDEARGGIRRIFRFADFPAAFAFMTAVAAVAEAHRHHPEWTNVYNRVDVLWTTHDCGGLSALDIELAAAMDGLYRAAPGGER